MELDKFDRKILQALQENGDYSMAELGEIAGLSHTPCWRRVKRLQAEGIIKGKVTLLDPDKLELSVTVYTYITIKSHAEESLNAFETAVQKVKEIVQCHSTSGDKDYILRVLVNSVSDYERLLKQTLIHLPNVASANSTFALKQIKCTTQLPI
ncbi:Lrp/AsnC family transcriptional regulator [Colwellia sp. KU-HH00111]|uniref:Lrp/AsnC family transcriptional regulator n=1 Tax=Colwellia sp. KU-HH00111 TaxID=3127652 RepID=UPI00310A98DF